MNNATRRACRLAAALCQLSMYMPSPAGTTVLAPASGPTHRTQTTQAHVAASRSVVVTATKPAPVAPPVAAKPSRAVLPAIVATTTRPKVTLASPIEANATVRSNDVATVAVEPSVDVAEDVLTPDVDAPACQVEFVRGPAVYVDHNDKREIGANSDGEPEWAVYLGDNVARGAQEGVTPTILRCESAAFAAMYVGLLREGKGGPRYAIPVEYTYDASAKLARKPNWAWKKGSKVGVVDEDSETNG